MMQEAEQLSDEGKHAEAAAIYRGAGEKIPAGSGRAGGEFPRGLRALSRGNYDAALASFKKVIDNKKLPPELATRDLR